MISNSVINYIFIGVINTLFGYGVIFLLLYTNMEAEIANFIGYFLGFFLSYYLNKKYNFKSNKSHREDLPKFIISMAISYILNLTLMVISYRVLNIDVYISQIIGGVIYTISGYILSKIWVFKI